MSAGFNTIDLDTLALSSGEGRRIELDLTPENLKLGGQLYKFDPSPVAAALEISRIPAGHAMRVRFTARLAGPCMRCLEDAVYSIDVEAREVHQPSAADEELRSPYVTDGELDVAAWAHDALALALPQALLCRPDCAGLCPVCGVSLNEVDPAEHVHEEAPDPRWAKLRELLD